MSSERHLFGSVDTDKKLSCLQQYLAAYSTALKNKNYSRIYIDAFAGTGSRTKIRAVLPFFDHDVAMAEEVTTPGSARIALSTSPAFHSVVLIEQDPAKIQSLKSVIMQYPAVRAHTRQGDANEIVQRICRRYKWQKERMRGVIFLDPYGMEVSWETVRAIANTEALDCWYFFPLSGLYRNAPIDSKKLDQIKINSLNRLFGTDAWRRDWYEDNNEQYNLFDQMKSVETRHLRVDRIEEWVHEHLKSVFKGAVLKPLRLRHSNGAPMASLFFAVSNPNKQAVKLASKIAGHILKAGISSQVR